MTLSNQAKREITATSAHIRNLMEQETEWITAAQFAEKHGIPTKKVSSYLSKLAAYGKIAVLRVTPGLQYPCLYRIKKIADASIQARINDSDKQRRERALLDQHMLGQISTNELAEVLQNEAQ